MKKNMAKKLKREMEEDEMEDTVSHSMDDKRSDDEEGNENEEEQVEDLSQKKKKKLPILKTDKNIDPEAKQKRSGVIYFSHIPPLFTVSRMRRELSMMGEVGRIFLQQEKRRTKDGKKRKKFTEGWVEFVSKSEAKRIALSINNTPVTVKNRGAAAGTMWNCKYLSGFKWIHLTEQLTYEEKMEKTRMRSEINQAKRVAEHFADQIEKGKHLKRLEEKVLKKKGVWEEYQRQIKQRKTMSAKKSLAKERLTTGAGGPTDDQLMKMIFAE